MMDGVYWILDTGYCIVTVSVGKDGCFLERLLML